MLLFFFPILRLSIVDWIFHKVLQITSHSMCLWLSSLFILYTVPFKLIYVTLNLVLVVLALKYSKVVLSRPHYLRLRQDDNFLVETYTRF